MYLKRKGKDRISFNIFYAWLKKYYDNYKLVNYDMNTRVRKNIKAFEIIGL